MRDAVLRAIEDMRKDLMTNSSELDTKGYDLSYPPLTYTEIYFVVYTKTNEMYLMENGKLLRWQKLSVIFSFEMEEIYFAFLRQTSF